MNAKIQLLINALDYEGRGVARHQGKTVFVDNALPQETVLAKIVQSKRSFDIASTEAILKPSSCRVKAACIHYQQCGGCTLQHIESSAQVAMKQRVFAEQLQRIGKVAPAIWLPALYGSAWHYRHRTRLTAKYLHDGRLLLGFLGKRSHQVVEIKHCQVLTQALSDSIVVIQDILQKLSGSLKKSIEAIELYHAQNVLALNIVSQKKLPENLFQQLFTRLKNETHQWQFWQQQGKQPPICVIPSTHHLAYRLPEWQLNIPFMPSDFTQVNHALNEAMVRHAMRLLAPQKNERIADLFCGLGNFSLPIARLGANVVGIEGLASLTQRAQDNARKNGLTNTVFHTADLFEIDATQLEQWGIFDKMLLDPPRAGALALVRALHKPFLPKKIVYVSCNPATFARDAAVLVEKGYVFQAAGVMNLFAQTAHIEAIGLFEWAE